MHALTLTLQGVELVYLAAGGVGCALCGWTLARYQHRWWRIRGFRHLVTIADMYGHFTIGDVMVAFDPSCAKERHRIAEFWRRSRAHQGGDLPAPASPASKREAA